MQELRKNYGKLFRLTLSLGLFQIPEKQSWYEAMLDGQTKPADESPTCPWTS